MKNKLGQLSAASSRSKKVGLSGAVTWDRFQHTIWFTSCLGLGLWQSWLCLDKYMATPTNSNMGMIDYNRAFEPYITLCPEGWNTNPEPQMNFELLARKYNISRTDYMDRNIWWSPLGNVTPDAIFEEAALRPTDFLSEVTIESDTSALTLRPEEAEWLEAYPLKSKIRCYTLLTKPTYPEMQSVTFRGRSNYSVSATLHHGSQADHKN
jgi:hypothetical protein